MERLYLKDLTPERVAALTQPVIVVDDEGNQIGYFEPLPDPAEWERYLDELSPEEWERRVNAGGRPLADYLAEIDLS